MNVLATGEPINLLLTDSVMPGGMSGIQLAHEARRQRPELKLVLTTGYTTAETPVAELGEDVPFLKKPYPLAELYSTVREALKS